MIELLNVTSRCDPSRCGRGPTGLSKTSDQKGWFGGLEAGLLAQGSLARCWLVVVLLTGVALVSASPTDLPAHAV